VGLYRNGGVVEAVRRILSVAALALLGVVARAQDGADPPGRVARLSEVAGAVSLAPAGSDSWTAAQLNRPITTGDRLWVERDSRAELELDTAMLRLGGETDASWLNLGDDVAQLRLTSGTLGVTVRRVNTDAAYEIDTPNAAVTLRRAGEYRIGLDASGALTVQVRTGEAAIMSNGQTVRVGGGQRAVIDGGGRFSARLEPLGPPDDFDLWCEERDRLWAGNPGGSYVGAGVVGYQQLSQYGDWQAVPDYGYVWFPNVTVEEWAPYRFGQWVWIAPWGWTWIDDEPWGFAPFHYGRWAYLERRWCWVPAPPRRRAVYAPALVAWVGGPGVATPGHIGRGVGWFPLAPGEVYVPGHRASPRYLQDVNLGNSAAVNPNRVRDVVADPRRQPYANRDVPRAVSAVPQNGFAPALPLQTPTPTPMPMPPAIVPERSAVAGHTVAHPPEGMFQREVMPEQRRRIPELSPQFSPPVQQQRTPVEAPQALQAPQVLQAPPRVVEPQRIERPPLSFPQQPAGHVSEIRRVEPPPMPMQRAPAPPPLPMPMPMPMPAPAPVAPVPQPQAQAQEQRAAPQEPGHQSQAPQETQRGRQPGRLEQ
jgi:hypothetical protein